MFRSRHKFVGFVKEERHKFTQNKNYIHTFHAIYQINLISKVQQKFGVFADDVVDAVVVVVVVAVDVLCSLLFISVVVAVVDDKWEEGSNVVAIDNCWDGVDVVVGNNSSCIFILKTNEQTIQTIKMSTSTRGTQYFNRSVPPI